MKKFTFSLPFLVTCLSALALLVPQSAKAQTKWQDDFSTCAAGAALAGQNDWMQYSSSGNGEVIVKAGALDFEGYPEGTSGNTLVFDTYNNQKVYHIFNTDKNDEAQTSGIVAGTVYASMLIKVTDVPTKNHYVFNFLKKGSASTVWQDSKTGTELARLYVCPSAANEDGKYRLGVNIGTDAKQMAYAETEYTVGTTYLVAFKYTINAENNGADNFALYVNPTSYTEEPATATALFDGTALGFKAGIKPNFNGQTFGIEGLELRQTYSASSNGVGYEVGMLRVADTWQGLFEKQSVAATPKITLSAASLDFGTIMQGTFGTKTITVHGVNLTSDVTVSTTAAGVSLSAQTLAKEDVMSEAGAQLTVTATPEGESTGLEVAFASEGAETVNLPLKWTLIPVTAYATAADFRNTEEPEYESVTLISEPLTVVYATEMKLNSYDDTYYKVFYLQGSGAAVPVVDMYGLLTETYAVGDVVENVYGYAFPGEYYNFIGNGICVGDTSFGTKQAEPAPVQPVEVTAAEFAAAPATYTYRLVSVKNATGVNLAADAAFATGKALTFTDGTGNFTVNPFPGTTLEGTPVSKGAMNITGIATSATAPILRPRMAEDVEMLPMLLIQVDEFARAEGRVGESTKVTTLHVTAVKLPAALPLEFSGKNRDQFELSLAEIPAGTGDYEIDLNYKPTAIGKHTASLYIESSLLEDMIALSLSGIAIDPANPPAFTLTSEQPAPFTAKAGTTQEQTITITTAHFPDYPSARMAVGGTFRISTSMLMKDNVDAPIKVTFAPTEAGTFRDTIIVVGYGADTLRIALEGTAMSADAEDKEGDSLPLDATSPLSLLNEHFDGAVKNQPFAAEGWKNLAMEGTRAWWGYEFPETDATAGEKAAKVTPYDSKVEEGNETPCEMLLVTPALDYVNAASKMFTFRVRGDYLYDEMPDKLELVYIELNNGEMATFPVTGFSMPATKDESGEWREFHIDLAQLEPADVFFMGFRFVSTRGTTSSATYYIDDVSFGRTDLPVIRPSETALTLNAIPGKVAETSEITVETENLEEPVALKLIGSHASKFSLSASSLPKEGGKFTVSFKADNEAIYLAQVQLSSRGAADRFIELTANNAVINGIDQVSVENSAANVTYDLSGRRITLVNRPGLYIVNGKKVLKK